MSRKTYLTSITAAAGICLVGILACLLSQIVARALFSTGLAWSGELARFLAVWAALLGAAAGREAGLLHAVDGVVRQLSPSVAAIVGVGRSVISIALLVFLIYAGIAMTDRALPQTSSAMQISMGWVYAALPVAAVLMLISEIADLWTRRRVTT